MRATQRRSRQLQWPIAGSQAADMAEMAESTHKKTRRNKGGFFVFICRLSNPLYCQSGAPHQGRRASTHKELPRLVHSSSNDSSSSPPRA